jgi:methylphosphotriester-DNA--protein-cysteine methyltransferase
VSEAVQRRGRITLERSLHVVDGVLVLRQRFAGDDTRWVVTHDAALRALVEVRSGRLVVPLASGDVVAPPRFVLAVPPRSILPLRFEDAEVDSLGTCAFDRLDAHASPAIEAARDEPALSPPRAYRAVLRPGPVLAQLDADAGVAGLLVRARAVLHAAIASPAPVRIAAAAVGIAPATLTRRFTEAYQMAPKLYCHRARLFDAATLLLQGASVIDAALRAGFNDLTRFYVQFRRRLGETPAAYARIRKRQEAPAQAG